MVHELINGEIDQTEQEVMVDMILTSEEVSAKPAGGTESVVEF